MGPTFGRLEHYRIHEYARASQGKTYKHPLVNKGEESTRRRGRPPKYPKINIPVIPKVELTEQELAESTTSSAASSNRIINGFKKFDSNEECPDPMCIYHMGPHFHCARPRCHHVTDRMDVLNLHAKDFHSFVTILEGFEFFDRNVNCRRAHCHNNKINKHFHCVKPKCDYSFVRHSTMTQHEKKHKAAESAEGTPEPILFNHGIEGPLSGYVPILPADPKGTVKTSGTFYPGGNSQQPVNMPMTPQVPSIQGIVPPLDGNTINSIATPVIIPTTNVSLPGGAANLPLTLLLQRRGQVVQSTWDKFQDQMHVGLHQICGRPFCKLKKKDHYHCFDCNQAFSDSARLRAHVGKHGVKFNKEDTTNKPITIAPLPVAGQSTTQEIISGDAHDNIDEELPPGVAFEDEEEKNADDELNKSSSLNLEFSTFSTMIAKAQKAQTTDLDSPVEEVPNSTMKDRKIFVHQDTVESQEGRLVIDEETAESEGEDFNIAQEEDDEAEGLSRKSGRKRVATKHEGFIDSNTLVMKVRKTATKLPSASTSRSSISSSSSLASLSPKDDTIPDGYIRIKQKDNCGFDKCAYRGGVTHFHCTRLDCGYSFSDRSRLIQHSLRHERIDSLTGGEMRQYRMNQPCGREVCDYQGKASHFHCLKCDYCCTDSSKVLTHRKYHAKMESILSQGFYKYSLEEDCHVTSCQYQHKQTHYHCTQEPCNYAVLGPAQMASHKLKHAS